MNDNKRKFAFKVSSSFAILVLGFIIFSVFPVFNLIAEESAEKTVEHVVEVQEITAEKAGVLKFGLIAAALAFGFGAIGAGIAIANVGSAAMGAIGEKPEIASQALIFIALAEGLVVFGFITALMILGKI